jgi:hypothetical protein
VQLQLRSFLHFQWRRLREMVERHLRNLSTQNSFLCHTQLIGLPIFGEICHFSIILPIQHKLELVDLDIHEHELLTFQREIDRLQQNLNL